MCENILGDQLNYMKKDLWVSLPVKKVMLLGSVWFSYPWKWRSKREPKSRGSPSFRTRDYHVQVSVSISWVLPQGQAYRNKDLFSLRSSKSCVSKAVGEQVKYKLWRWNETAVFGPLTPSTLEPANLYLWDLSNSGCGFWSLVSSFQLQLPFTLNPMVSVILTGNSSNQYYPSHLLSFIYCHGICTCCNCHSNLKSWVILSLLNRLVNWVSVRLSELVGVTQLGWVVELGFKAYFAGYLSH